MSPLPLQEIITSAPWLPPQEGDKSSSLLPLQEGVKPTPLLLLQEDSCPRFHPSRGQSHASTLVGPSPHLLREPLLAAVGLPLVASPMGGCSRIHRPLLTAAAFQSEPFTPTRTPSSCFISSTWKLPRTREPPTSTDPGDIAMSRSVSQPSHLAVGSSRWRSPYCNPFHWFDLIFLFMLVGWFWAERVI